MKTNFIETLTHMFKTMDTYGFRNCGWTRVDDITKYTDGHYTGPGFVYELKIMDSEYDIADYTIVMDENQTYVGTMAWITDNSGWFNDINPEWYKTKEKDK